MGKGTGKSLLKKVHSEREPRNPGAETADAAKFIRCLVQLGNNNKHQHLAQEIKHEHDDSQHRHNEYLQKRRHRIRTQTDKTDALRINASSAEFPFIRTTKSKASDGRHRLDRKETSLTVEARLRETKQTDEVAEALK